MLCWGWMSAWQHGHLHVSSKLVQSIARGPSLAGSCPYCLEFPPMGYRSPSHCDFKVSINWSSNGYLVGEVLA
eukprot:1391918-Amorphochlora_amoeboformis.AAC.1